MSGTFFRWKILLWVFLVSRHASGTSSARYVVKVSSRSPWLNATTSPFRCVSLDSSGSWRWIVAFFPSTCSYAIFCLFSAIISTS